MAFPPISIFSMTTTDYNICEAQHKMKMWDSLIKGISRWQKQSIKPSVGSSEARGSMPKKLIIIHEASSNTSNSFIVLIFFEIWEI